MTIPYIKQLCLTGLQFKDFLFQCSHDILILFLFVWKDKSQQDAFSELCIVLHKSSTATSGTN